MTWVELHEIISSNKGQKGCVSEVVNELKAVSMLKIKFTTNIPFLFL